MASTSSEGKSVTWTKFSESSLSPWLKKNLESLHIDRASPVQQMLISAIISPTGKRLRRNVFACSPTGTGKTLAYVLPILHLLSQDLRPYFALILAPTRELCYQINEIIRVLSGSAKHNSPTMIKTQLLIGGGKTGSKLNESERQGFWHGKPNIIVATPGRLQDQMSRRDHLEHCGHKSSLRFDFLVLDEADILIGPSFANQLKDILQVIDEGPTEIKTEQRQTLVLSATLTTALEQLQKLFDMTGDKALAPVTINLMPTIDEIKMDLAQNPNLDQRYVLCPDSVKPAYLIQALSDLSFKQVIVFCGSRRQAKLIHRIMVNLGFDDPDTKCHPVLLIGNNDQKERLQALESFKSLRSRILVATGGLAGRGLDLPQVDLVINYSCPQSAVEYVHRVGRTCRKIDFARIDELEKIRANIKIVREAQDANNHDVENVQTKKRKKSHQLSKAVSKFYGKSLLFVTQYDVELMKNIESFMNIKLTEEDEIDGDNVPNILKPVAIAMKDAELSIAEEYKALNDRRKR